MAAQFTDENFDADVLKSDKPVLVDFYATWCGPCKMLAPIIDELAEEYDGKISIGKLDVDDAPKAAQKYGIQSIPAIIIFKNGEIVEKLTGFQSKEVLVEKLDAIL